MGDFSLPASTFSSYMPCSDTQSFASFSTPIEDTSSLLGEVTDEAFDISQTAIDEALQLAHRLSCQLPINNVVSALLSKQQVLDVLSRCTREFGHGQALADALRDFGNTTWPSEALSRDAHDLARMGDVQKLVELRHAQMAENRFNLVRCNSVFKDDPEYATLRSFAVSGVFVDTSIGFRRQTSSPPLRPLHNQLLPVYRHHAIKLWREGKALLLPPHQLEKAGCHFNPAHWTSKPGKTEGRFLGDCTNGNPDNVLNSAQVKSLVGLRFGSLSHPTIGDVVEAIYEMAREHGGLSQLQLWKEDVVGAFGQFNYTAESACLFAFKIDDELALLQHTGMFGWTGSPYAFGVFSRALQRVASLRISGRTLVYVDDFMGISPSRRATEDQLSIQSLLTEVFGSGAVNPAKSFQPSHCQEFLGWHINLLEASIRPSDRAIRKLLFCFFGVSSSRGQRVPLAQIQRLASLSYRYSQGIVGMTSFVYPFFEATKGPQNVKTRRLGTEARMCITVWRCVALLLYSHPSHLAVPLRSLSSDQSSPSVRIWSDAGPYRLGVRVDHGSDASWIAYTSYMLPFDASESKFQNAREFMGLLLGLMMLTTLGFRNCSVLWRGDNTSALSWARHNYAHSLSCQKAFFVYTWLSILTQTRVVHTEHWRGVDMGDIDGLSRGFSTAFDSHASGLPPDFHSRVNVLFQQCDPTAHVATDPLSLSHLFIDLLSLISSLLSS